MGQGSSGGDTVVPVAAVRLYEHEPSPLSRAPAALLTLTLQRNRVILVRIDVHRLQFPAADVVASLRSRQGGDRAVRGGA